MERVMLVSQMKAGSEESAIDLLRDGLPALSPHRAEESGLRRYSVFRYERLLLVYAELEGTYSAEGSFWGEKLEQLLNVWPGDSGIRYATRLNDIFHDDVPSDDVPWRRPEYKPEMRIGSLARLKPEQYARYVFLHYQLQEEQPRLFNKYYMIGSFDQFIFSYQELPALRESSRPGLLSTSHTPSDWQAAMLPHFNRWPDKAGDEQLWRLLEEVVSVE